MSYLKLLQAKFLAGETGLSLTLSETLKTGFDAPRFILNSTIQLMVYDNFKCHFNSLHVG